MTIAKTSKRDILQIRNLPGLQKVEDRLLLYETGNNLSAESETLLDSFCIKNFEVHLRQFDFPWPQNFDRLPDFEKWEIEKEAEVWDANFETSGASPEQAVEIFRKYGIDFTDKFGKPLLCTEYLMRSVEFAARGIKGKIPIPTDVDINNWEVSIQEQVARFKSQKKQA